MRLPSVRGGEVVERESGPQPRRKGSSCPPDALRAILEGQAAGVALGRRVVSDAARTEPPLGLGASSGIRRDECDHNPRLAWSRKPVRQVSKSLYSKAWEPG